MDKVSKTKKIQTQSQKNKDLLFGKMKGKISFHGDIIQPIGEEWDANNPPPKKQKSGIIE
jgi:hypothetical protein